jgi:hypothetical protein
MPAIPFQIRSDQANKSSVTDGWNCLCPFESTTPITDIASAHPLTLDVYTSHETRHNQTPAHPIETSVFLSTSLKPKCEFANFLTPTRNSSRHHSGPEKKQTHTAIFRTVPFPPRLSPCLSLNIVTGFYAVFHVSHLEPIDCALRTVSAQHVEFCTELYLMRLASYHL